MPPCTSIGSLVQLIRVPAGAWIVTPTWVGFTVVCGRILSAYVPPVLLPCQTSLREVTICSELEVREGTTITS